MENFYEKNVAIYMTYNGERLKNDDGEYIASTFGWDGKWIYRKELFKAVKLCRFEVEDPWDYCDEEYGWEINLCDIGNFKLGSRVAIVRHEKKQAEKWRKLCEEKGWEGGDESLYSDYKKAFKEAKEQMN